MQSYRDVSWDANSFSQLPDDDFLALWQKQFPANNPNPYQTGLVSAGIDPQNISTYSLPSLTPPSEDSSPSPPNLNNDSPIDDHNEPALKRKASDEDFEEGPSSKSQHTSGNDKKSSSSRRKSSNGGGNGKDETRLLKRKEQNRAAQRAFRERKEKHVKDLEDKVAALEAKNEQAVSENENLRDLLSRLQNENVALKQSSFTFAVPKTAGSNPEKATTPTLASFSAESPSFASTSTAATSVSSPVSTRESPKPANSLDWTSLTSFDPAMLSLLDEDPQPTATDGAMSMDFGFGVGGLSSNFTTIATNPTFMSDISMFDHPVSVNNSPSFSFDMNSLSTWSTPISSTSQEGSALDELFGSGYLNPPTSADYNHFSASPSSLSPIAHHSAINTANKNSQSSPAPSNSSQESSASARSAFSDKTGETSTSATSDSSGCDGTQCPKSRAELADRIEQIGTSPFAPPLPTQPTVRKASDGVTGPMVMCSGSSFPMTSENDKNIEVLSAWRSITSNPKFKDTDINELCTQFTKKARCDGTKVVLEPQGVHHIMETLSTRQ